MPYRFVALGEVLWDLIGDRRHVGGAPLNFAYHAQCLGAASTMISRVGADDLGRDLLAAIQALGVSVEQIQVDMDHPTGTVPVTLDTHGVPTFTIVEQVAWDFLEFHPELLPVVAGAQVVCFGTLAQRHPVSGATIQHLVSESTNALRVYDVNLRQQYYDAEVIHASLMQAHLVKLNADELVTLQQLLGWNRFDEEALLLRFLRTYALRLVCVTRGAEGCTLRTLSERVDAPGYAVPVADTVGSGDAFTAALCFALLENMPLREAADLANRAGAYVASRPGATPPMTRAGLDALQPARRTAPSLVPGTE